MKTETPIPAKASRAARALRGISRLMLLMVLLALFAGAASFFHYFSQISDLRSADQMQAADGIVVLTGGKDRIGTALDLLDRKLGQRLLISGVHPQTSAAAIRRTAGGSSQMFDCCVDIDRAALDTLGNAEETGKWAQDNGFASLIVVTSDYHMPRSLIEMRRANPGIDFVPHPVTNIATDGSGWLAEPGHIRMVAAEYLKYLAASLGMRLDRSAGTALASAGTR